MKKLIDAQTAYRTAKEAYEAKAAEVKKLHNEVYAPLCEEKRALKEELESAKVALEQEILANKDLLELARSISRA